MAKVFRAFVKVPTVLTKVLARLSLCSMGLGVVKGTGRTVGISGCGLLISLQRVGGTSLSGGAVFVMTIVYVLLVTVLC